ncbi:hypothetical protein QO227_22530, partial [Vibrio vulnificus]|uniref:hypothetical protein n=1 Tax=Vibrio vulnificus TaxID=672 RepID=UPI002A51303F|nr:hypothetical protein [Vibrio vulnificus]
SVIPAQAGIHSSACAERTLFVGLIDSKTSSRFKMDPRVRKDDEQEPRAVRNFATFDIRHSRAGGNPFLSMR